MRIPRLLVVSTGAAVLWAVPPTARGSGALQPEITPSKPGLVITNTTTVRRGTYRLASAGLDAPVITIRGAI